MTAMVTENLSLLAGAPSGLGQLRQLILNLAMSGKLVQQDSSDETAQELLVRIAEARAMLSGVPISRRRTSTAVNDEILHPVRLPPNWAMVPVTAVYVTVSARGGQLLSSQVEAKGKYPVVDQGKRFIAGYTDREDLLIKTPGPVIVFGDHTTERKYINFDFVVGADGVKILSPILISERFFWWQLVGYQLENRGYARHFKVLNSCSFALPPLAEQHRIVAKVDELMALCDRLETRQSDAQAAHARLVDELLGSLLQARDAEDFAECWGRVKGSFDVLFTTLPSIDALKQAVLQLAVTGRLVKSEQDSAGGWITQRIEEFCTVQGGIQKTPLRRPVSQHFPYLRVLNVQRNRINVTELERYELTLDELDRWRLNAGDLLIVEGNGSENEIGRCAIWNGEVDDCVYQNHLMRVRPHEPHCVVYLALYLNSPEGMAHMRRLAITTSGLFNLSVGKIRSIPVAMPSLAEQQRILAKVTELLAFCDKLKTRIATARTKHAQLAEALTSSLLN